MVHGASGSNGQCWEIVGQRLQSQEAKIGQTCERDVHKVCELQFCKSGQSSSRMRVINHNWSPTKQRPHPQSVAEISVVKWSVIKGMKTVNSGVTRSKVKVMRCQN